MKKQLISLAFLSILFASVEAQEKTRGLKTSYWFN